MDCLSSPYFAHDASCVMLNIDWTPMTVWRPLTACLWRQCWRIVLQVVDQHQRHRDVRRQRHVAVDDHLSQFVQHQRQIFSVRRTELHDEVRVVDLRRFPGSFSAHVSRSIHISHVEGQTNKLDHTSDVARNYVYGEDPIARGARVEAPVPSRVQSGERCPFPSRLGVWGASWAPQWGAANAFFAYSTPQNASRRKKIVIHVQCRWNNFEIISVFYFTCNHRRWLHVK